MKVRFDESADALYIRWDETPTAGSDQVGPGLGLGFDGRELVLGIEVQTAQTRLPGAPFRQIRAEVA